MAAVRAGAAKGALREIRMLEALAAAGSASLSAAECVEATGIPRATCHRLLNLLVAEGYAQHRGRGRYGMGWRLYGLYRALRGASPLAGAPPVLEALVARTGQTAHLGVLDGPVAVYLECVDSPSSLRLAARPGSRIPINVSAIGMAIAAFLPPRELEALVASGDWTARSPLSIADGARLRAELAAVRARGYAVDAGGYAVDVRCVAAPVRGAGGGVVAAVGITGLASTLRTDDPAAVGAVLEAAAALEEQAEPGRRQG